MRPGRIRELLTGTTPARTVVRRAGRGAGGWTPAREDMEGRWRAAAPDVQVDDAAEADQFSPEDREQLRDEAERLGVTPGLVAQRLGMVEDPDGLWRDREAGE
jgi:hypothetical protein